ncbi:MAG: antitoxin YezG family protein [Propionibacteriaceae bacterium]|jgi:hypothetical protein|nr:antitoxin YezG family protein [Propionibacteriaceae bacterium]
MSELLIQPERLTEREALLGCIDALWRVFPIDADSIICQCAALSNASWSRTYVYLPDGTGTSITASREVHTAFTELRKAMYRPGLGTWWSATLTVWDSGQNNIEYNYDTPPEWNPGGIYYVDDLHHYPINPEFRPQWLRERLAQGVTDLRERGPEAYPPWLAAEVQAGRKPAWLEIDP